MRVIFAEKPSMGRAIAQAIGLTGSGKSSISGKDRSGKPVTVTWGVGHLVALKEGFEDYDPALKTWTEASLPFIPETFKTDVIPDSRDQFKAVKDILKDPAVTEAVVATDAGREGELIALYVFDKVGFKKPTLRLWASSLTEESLQAAYSNLKPWSTYKGLQESAQCRSEADWIVGLNGTRALTLRTRKMGFQANGAWAVGRVMTPTLAILVNRELEIQNFQSRNYWTLEATFQAKDGQFKGKWFKGEDNSFPAEVDARALVARLKGKPAKVKSVDTRDEQKPPQQFYDLTQLQQEANRRFGYSADATLKITQELYEAKVLSYPRTDSKHLTESDAKKIPAWLNTLKSIPDYAGFVSEVLAKPSLTLGKRFVDDSEVEDHSALMPTEIAPNLAALPENQRRIFDLVARRFLAAFFPHRIEAKTVIISEIEDETFKTTGTVVTQEGWSRVDTPMARKPKKGKKGQGEAEDKDDTKGLPRVNKAEALNVLALDAPMRETEPPKRYTEADLLEAMKTAGKEIDDDEIKQALKEIGVTGIGTPATRAATIEKLLSKGSPKRPKEPLVERQKNHLIPTQRGITLIQLVPVEDLKSPELTGRWEADLDAVRKGTTSRSGFMQRIAGYTQNLVQQMLHSEASKDIKMTPSDSPNQNHSDAPRFEPKQLQEDCPKCGSALFLKQWDGRFYVACGKSKDKDCKLAFNSDDKGAPSAGKCKFEGCGGPVTTTKGGSKICVKCNQWQEPKAGATTGEGQPAPAGERPAATPRGECPKCGVGKLNQRPGQYGPFVSCSDRACGLIYDVLENGEPKGGWCKDPKCKGPVRSTKGGSKICVKCDQWQTEKPGGSPQQGVPAAPKGPRPPEPPPSSCPYCQGRLKAIFIQAKQKYSMRCDPCSKWIDPPKTA